MPAAPAANGQPSSTVRILPPPPDDSRTEVGGAICPCCRLAADLSTPDRRVPHACITRGKDVGALLVAADTVPYAGADLLAQLDNHPARPYDSATRTMRPVDRTWCQCACDPNGKVIPASAEAGHSSGAAP